MLGLTMNGGFPLDIVLFALVAAFLALRLRSVLGKRTGYERPPAPITPPARTAGPVIDGTVEPAGPASHRVLPDPATPAGQALSAMAQADHNFDPGRFLDGAEQAFRLIVNAFAAGDRAALQSLLAPETLAAFEAAITAREQAGETQKTIIHAITELRIESASLHGTQAEITIRYQSDQFSHVVDKAGQTVHGADALTEIVDIWTYIRDLSSPDPSWRLAGARSG